MIRLLIASMLNFLVNAQWITGQCTFHNYEGDMKSLGKQYDNTPGWCGIRYSKLNVARITAVHGLQANMCNQCLEMVNSKGGPSVFVLAVDQKGDPGLDVAKSSFMATFPGANPLDPQSCKWRVVDPTKCGTICYGSKDECTPGKRNILPIQSLPVLPDAPIGLNGVDKNNDPINEVELDSIDDQILRVLAPGAYILMMDS
ncbi:hypothetical protein BC833DRAFT_590977 [Globomyces pollinis-pini]|nr:hypothetical protein BC833DRAFT_590977 [Globomyces pollinis-pini]KAJ2992214.1 hypothetical protein HDV02_003200 [Globomyces sp. JEL0801]